MSDQLQTHKIRFLILAIIFYGVLSSPTPDVLTWVEALIAVLLILSTQMSRLLYTLHHQPKEPLFIALVYGLSVPLFMALYHAHTTNDIWRDVLPYIYFTLPFFILPRCNTPDQREYWAETICFWMAFAGVIMCLRFFLIVNMPLHLIGEQQAGDNLLYLTSSPLVPFACIYCFLKALQIERPQFFITKGLIARAIYAFGGIMIVAALAATLQRATFALVFLSVAAYVLHQARYRPAYAYGLLFVTVIALVLTHQVLLGTVSMMWSKTLKVFDNSRLYELRSVWDHIAQSPLTVIWGNGWGAKFYSPAAGFVWVRYTHTLFSYVLFKAGLIGLFIIGRYIFMLCSAMWRLFWTKTHLALALFPSFFLGITLYPTFKMLGFGLIVSVILGLGGRHHD